MPPCGRSQGRRYPSPPSGHDDPRRHLGKELSVIAGERNKASVHDWKTNHTEDEYIRSMGSFYSDND